MKQVQTLDAIRHCFAGSMKRFQRKRDRMQAEIKRLEKELAALNDHSKNLSYPYWTEKLLRPILREIKKHFKDWDCDDKHLTQMGLGSRVSIFFTRKHLHRKDDPNAEGNSIYIVFIPGNLDEGELFYETGERKENYPANSIGDINGFNQVSKMLTSIEEAVEHLRKQIIHLPEN